MLDTIAKKFQAAVLMGLVLILVLVFVLQFGAQQAEGFSSGGTEVAASVRGDDVTMGDFRAVYTLLGFDRAPEDQQRLRRTREAVMNGIIDRKLLAKEADRIGLVVTPEAAMEALVTKDTVMVTLGQDASPYFPQGELTLGLRDEQGNFDREGADIFIRNRLRRSIGEFSRWQAEERMAEMMRDTVRAGAVVSPAEVRAAYEQENDKAKLDYAVFRSAFYRTSIEPTDAQITAYLAEHEAEVTRDYEANSRRYKDLPEQVRARHILVRSRQSDSEEERAAARAKAEALAARVAREDFVTVARAESQDESSAPTGGDLGFIRRGQQPDSFEDALFGLEVGATSGVVETSQGFHVIQAVARREGDVPEAEAKKEIAERLYREEAAKAAAKAAADEAQAFLASGGDAAALGATLSAAAEGASSLAPTVTATPLFGRTENPFSGAGNTSDLLEAAFALSEDAPLPAAPIQVGNDFYVIHLAERVRPTDEGFDAATQASIRERLLAQKQAESVAAFTAQLRARAEAEGDIRVLPSIFNYGDGSADDGAAGSS